MRRIESICAAGMDERALRMALLGELRTWIPCDAYAWLLTDPETSVGNSPLAETPSLADLPTLIRLKYSTSVNRWTSLPTARSVTLLGATEGHPETSAMFNSLLRSYGVTDVLSVAFADQHGCWAFLDLWRCGGEFGDRDRSALDAASAIITPALRSSLRATFESEDGLRDDMPMSDQPAVALLSDDLGSISYTPQSVEYLRALLPTEADRAPVPAAIYNVAAQLVARENGIDPQPPWTRAHLRRGAWVTLSAARLAALHGDAAPIAVTIGPTSPALRVSLYSRVVGLTDREAELLRHLVGGHDTARIARTMFLSAYTVQDHLKAIFAKTGATNRRVLVARATGALVDDRGSAGDGR